MKMLEFWPEYIEIEHQANGCIRIEFADVPAILGAVLRSLNAHLPDQHNARWLNSPAKPLSTSQTVYYWENNLYDIYNRLHYTTEDKITIAQDYIAKSGIRERIWKDALLSLSRICSMGSFSMFESLVNPPPYSCIWRGSPGRNRHTEIDPVGIDIRYHRLFEPCSVITPYRVNLYGLEKLFKKVFTVIDRLKTNIKYCQYKENIEAEMRECALIADELSQTLQTILSRKTLKVRGVPLVSLQEEAVFSDTCERTLKLYETLWTVGDKCAFKGRNTKDQNPYFDLMREAQKLIIFCQVATTYLNPFAYPRLTQLPRLSEHDVSNLKKARVAPMIQPRKIKLIDCVKLTLEYPWYPTIQAQLEFNFKSEAGARIFYQQFNERFIRGQILGFSISGFLVGRLWVVRVNHINATMDLFPSRYRFGHRSSTFSAFKSEMLEIFERDCKQIFVNDWQIIFELLLEYFEIPLIEKITHFPKPFDQKQHYELVSSRSGVLPFADDDEPPQVDNYTDQGEWSEVGNTRVFKANGFPLANIGWPFQRGYLEYAQLLIPQLSEETIRDRWRVYQRDYLKNLPPDPVIIEFGAGAGNVCAYTREKMPQATIVAASVTPLAEKNISACNSVYLAPIANSLALMRDYMNRGHRVIDVFGAGTYADNPVHALIYAYFVLRVTGEYFVIISGLTHDYDATPLGDGLNRADIIEFFAQEMGVDLEIKKSKVASMVQPGKIVEDFVVTFAKTADTLVCRNMDDFLELCRRADEIIGKPRKVVDKDDNFGKFDTSKKNTNINTIHYCGGKSYSGLKMFAEPKELPLFIIEKTHFLPEPGEWPPLF